MSSQCNSHSWCISRDSPWSNFLVSLTTRAAALNTRCIEENNNEIYCRRWGCLSASETRDVIGYQRVRREMWLAELASETRDVIGWISEWDERCDWLNSWTRHRLKHLNWRSRWIILYTLEWRMAVSCEISWADRCFWLVLLTDHKVLHCYAPNVVFRCLDAGQLYSSCRFSSADWRCFQVTDPCWAILLTAFVHHTALIRRDF